MYNKLKFMIEIGKLEVHFEEDSKIITELSNLREKVHGNDVLEVAIAFGRLQARIGKVTEELQTMTSILSTSILDENMSIDELGFSVKTFNFLSRANIKTVKQIEEVSSENWSKMRNITTEIYNEISKKMHELGFNIAPFEKKLI